MQVRHGPVRDFIRFRVRADPFVYVLFPQHQRHPVMDEGDLFTGRPGEHHKVGKTVFKTVQPAEPGDAVALRLNQVLLSGFFLAIGAEKVLTDSALRRGDGPCGSRLRGCGLCPAEVPQAPLCRETLRLPQMKKRSGGLCSVVTARPPLSICEAGYTDLFYRNTSVPASSASVSKAEQTTISARSAAATTN